MLSGRGARLSRLLSYVIGVLCLCVIMYVLGSTMTLWSLAFALDQTDNPVLEGFSLPAMVSDLNPAMPAMPSDETCAAARSDLNEHGLLRPPNQTA